MIVDTSAIVAILTDEPERELFLGLLANGTNLMSAGTWLELAAVVTRRFGREHHNTVDALVSALRIAIVPVTPAQAAIGRDGCQLYGRGTQHPARLNFGDCFAYALAKETGLPLLFKGGDFSHTDIVSAVA